MDSVTALSDLMAATADAVCACLEAETVNGAPGNCGLYWSTPPDDFLCDCADPGGSLDVWLEIMQPTNRFPAPYLQPIDSAIGPLGIMATINVRLTRPCWPVIESNPGGLTPPVRSTTDTPTLNLLIDASVVYCCLLNDFTAASGESLITGGPCSNIALGALIPDRNRSGCAGFTVKFTVNLGSCCIPAEAS